MWGRGAYLCQQVSVTERANYTLFGTTNYSVLCIAQTYDMLCEPAQCRKTAKNAIMLGNHAEGLLLRKAIKWAYSEKVSPEPCLSRCLVLGSLTRKRKMSTHVIHSCCHCLSEAIDGKRIAAGSRRTFSARRSFLCEHVLLQRLLRVFGQGLQKCSTLCRRHFAQ